MITLEDGCVDCGLPCLGGGCPYHGKFFHFYCDHCEGEGELYKDEGKQICRECLLDKYVKRCDECGEIEEYLYSYDEKVICEECFLKKFEKVDRNDY